MSSAGKHIPVLLEETVAALAVTSQSIVVDATFGSGGHGAKLLGKLGKDGVYLGLDVDATAIAAAQLPTSDATVLLERATFSELQHVLAKHQIVAPNAILADLGWRSEQFEAGEKGFSFHADEPLLMTFGDASHYTVTAHDIVNEWSEQEIANVLIGYGEERFAHAIARAIVTVRSKQLIETAATLSEIVTQAVPAWYRFKRIHPATKTFQALRIAVNDELAELERFLNVAWQALAPSGRLAIITFHSLEDRMVKQTFKQLAAEDNGTLVTRKPIRATHEEQHANQRARSALLRVIEKNYENASSITPKE